MVVNLAGVPFKVNEEEKYLSYRGTNECPFEDLLTVFEALNNRTATLPERYFIGFESVFTFIRLVKYRPSDEAWDKLNLLYNLKHLVLVDVNDLYNLQHYCKMPEEYNVGRIQPNVDMSQSIHTVNGITNKNRYYYLHRIEKQLVEENDFDEIIRFFTGRKVDDDIVDSLLDCYKDGKYPSLIIRLIGAITPNRLDWPEYLPENRLRLLLLQWEYKKYKKSLSPEAITTLSTWWQKWYDPAELDYSSQAAYAASWREAIHDRRYIISDSNILQSRGFVFDNIDLLVMSGIDGYAISTVVKNLSQEDKDSLQSQDRYPYQFSVGEQIEVLKGKVIPYGLARSDKRYIITKYDGKDFEMQFNADGSYHRTGTDYFRTKDEMLEPLNSDKEFKLQNVLRHLGFMRVVALMAKLRGRSFRQAIPLDYGQSLQVDADGLKLLNLLGIAEEALLQPLNITEEEISNSLGRIPSELVANVFCPYISNDGVFSDMTITMSTRQIDDKGPLHQLHWEYFDITDSREALFFYEDSAALDKSKIL